ncbi:hypothetical protein SAMN05216582_103106 [Selenomonas ruminantium]|uniref:Uncharacterized protein n=1 Tax=Selenomonas ruminantium TaxID=971 RepID=A0A1M6S410_SELRU|nr:hypothetical protein [Selenomonas ruminantium]SHK39574.1 hypothetical protein SAMN05216582_103106 [Selenomonas ruminantium]
MKKIFTFICLSCFLMSTASASTIVRHERTVNNPETRIETEIERPTPFTHPAEEPVVEPAPQEERPPETAPENPPTDKHTDSTPQPEKGIQPPVKPKEPELPPKPDYVVSTADKFLGTEKPAANPWLRQGSNNTYNYNDSIFLYGGKEQAEEYVIALRAQTHKNNPAVKYNFLIIMLGRGQDQEAMLDNVTLPVLVFTDGNNESQKQFYSTWMKNQQSLMLRIDGDIRDKIIAAEKLTIKLNTAAGTKDIPLPDSVHQQWKDLIELK